jgi:hypothetical protein
MVLDVNVNVITNHLTAVYHDRDVDLDLMHDVVPISPVSLDTSWKSWYSLSASSSLTVRIHHLNMLVRVWIEALNLRVAVEVYGEGLIGLIGSGLEVLGNEFLML